MKKINQVAKLCGTSVRTLHYYDEIGLLCPKTEENGYRLYTDKDLERLMEILFFKELDFPLSEIKAILNNKNYDKITALKSHKTLLAKKKQRLASLIDTIDQNINKGFEFNMLKEFSMEEIETTKQKYSKETREKYGETDAYKQSEKRTSTYKEDDWRQITEKSNEIFYQFSKIKDPASKNAQQLVGVWQSLITKYFYTCTDEILTSLGEMYVNDERFKSNIDKFAPGTAQCMSSAIKIYTSKTNQ